MHFLAVAFATAAFLGSSLAVPVERAAYSWQISKWSVAGDDNEYGFTVKGDGDGEIPPFKAHCAGTQQGGYKECEILQNGGAVAGILNVYANVKPGLDSEGPNGQIQRLFVKTYFANDISCSFKDLGYHDAKSANGRFKIFPTQTAGPCPVASVTA